MREMAPLTASRLYTPPKKKLLACSKANGDYPIYNPIKLATYSLQMKKRGVSFLTGV